MALTRRAVVAAQNPLIFVAMGEHSRVTRRYARGYRGGYR